MPNIKPISDLRNYSAVLEDVTVGSPVYLTKNGHGCYTIMDINEQEEMSRKARKYDKMVAELEVMKMLNEGLKECQDYFILPQSTQRTDPSWFGFLITIRDNVTFKRREAA